MNPVTQPRTGLASVTFRALSPNEIVTLVKEAGMDGIEWGGDIHVPHGDLHRASEVSSLTHAAGLEVVCYGSYYNLGKSSGADQCAWKDVVETAIALGAPLIRIWPGVKGSADTTPDEFASMVARAREEAEIAASRGIKVVCEFHKNTLTDSAASAVKFLRAVDHPAFGTLWQPIIGASVQENLSAMRLLAPWLSHLHVFYWDRGESKFEQRPLSEGKRDWQRFVTEAALHVPGAFHLIEFVRGRDPAQFREDAKVLHHIMAQSPD